MVSSLALTDMSGYAASRAALETLSRSLSIELGKEGIAVTLMYPPPTGTGMGSSHLPEDYGRSGEGGPTSGSQHSQPSIGDMRRTGRLVGPVSLQADAGRPGPPVRL